MGEQEQSQTQQTQSATAIAAISSDASPSSPLASSFSHLFSVVSSSSSPSSLTDSLAALSALIHHESPQLVTSLVNQRDSSGRSLFHYACLHGFCPLLDFLRGLGPAIAVALNERDGQGQTGLHLALKQPRIEYIHSLLSIPAHSLDRLISDEFHRLPLHWAAQAGSDNATLDKLIEQTTQDTRTTAQLVNSCTISGDTPLHWSVSAGRLSASSWLIDRGADANKKNARGIAPVDMIEEIADECVKKDMAALLADCRSKRKLSASIEAAAAPFEAASWTVANNNNNTNTTKQRTHGQDSKKKMTIKLKAKG